LPKFVADDESSRFKEITSTRSIAFYGGSAQRTGKTYKGLYKGARHVVFLDGSPMPNGRPMELWAPVYALDPEVIDCMDRHDFGLYFCNGHQDRWGKWKYDGSTRPTEFRDRLKKRFMHIVTEDQLKHPERRRSLLFMDKDVRSAKQKTWEREHLKKLNLEKISEKASQGEFAKWRRELGLKKVNWVAEYTTSRFKNKNESILIFCWHREVVQKLSIELGKTFGKEKVAIIFGGTTLKQRSKIIKDFNKGRVKAIVCNIQAAGRGTDGLQGAADRVIFGEFSWSDELNKQCEKRASRKGSKKKFIRCDYIAAPDSMEERVLNSIFNKEKKNKLVMQ
jgi:SNF2 family DNA or RNA helicase